MVILASNVTHTLSDEFSVNQKLAVDLNIATGPTGEVFQPNIILEYGAKQSSGYMALQLFDKDNNKTAEVSWSGKLGALATVYNNEKYMAFALMFLKAGAVESIGELYTSDNGQIKSVNNTLSPTNYSTGKLKLIMSGKQASGTSFSMNPTIWGPGDSAHPTVTGCGQVQAVAPGVSGHAEVIIDFSIVAI